ncbi:hypothetical protein ACTQ5X_06605 [Jeotgalibaca porci]|uniref:hypothetical protein n=1 Tax=Jeotgalibaca porci TaxID=1868793 RepID=UPI003F90F04B
MDEVNFKNWLEKYNFNSKVQSDLISRLKRLERELGNCDLDKEFKKNECKYLLSLFDNKGINKEMERFGEVSLPIGQYHLSTYKYALNKYIHFSRETVKKIID